MGKFGGNRKGIVIVMSVLVSVLSIFLISYFAFGEGSNGVSDSLRLVSVVFRHGDRTPTDTYPNDPYRDDSYWSQGWGALTTLGKQQMFSFGAYLRKRYENFLSEKYLPEEVYVVSSDHDRCLMSAQVCLAGLYPPVGEQKWKSDLLWQPVPVHTVPKHLDQLIVMRKPCPAYNKAFNETYSSSYIEKINSENSDLYKYLTEKTGNKVDSILAIESLHNTLEIEERNKLRLPDWTKGVYPNKTKDLAALSLALFTYSNKQKRLKGGPLVGDIVQHSSQKALRTLKPNRKIFLYSGHDLNLVSTMRVLGFPDLIKPESGAAIFFELHASEEGNHFIKVFYMKSPGEIPVLLKIHGCEENCLLQKFLELTKPYVPDNWDEECQLT